MKQKHDEIASMNREESYTKIWFKKAAELLGKKNIHPESVIDIGAGKGEFLEILKGKFANLKLYAIDYTETNLEVLNRKGINTFQLDLDNFKLEELGYLKGKFDLAVCLEVIEHIFDLDRLFILCNYVLRENGYLLISTPNMASSQARLFYMLRGYPYGENHHVRFLTKKRVEQYTCFTGFDIIDYGNYFDFNTDIIRRGFGIRNRYIVNALAMIFCGPSWLFSRLGIWDSLNNSNIVLVAQKINLPPLGLEMHNFQAKFEKLDKHNREMWKSRLGDYYKRDKMKEHIYFSKHIAGLISGNRNES